MPRRNESCGFSCAYERMSETLKMKQITITIKTAESGKRKCTRQKLICQDFLALVKSVMSNKVAQKKFQDEQKM